MHRGDVADRRIGGERPIERLRIVRLVLRALEGRHAAAVAAGDLDHAPAIGAVDQHQQLAGLGHERRQHRLDHEGAAALERHRDMAAGAAGELDQTGADAGVQRDEVLDRASPSRAASPA